MMGPQDEEDVLGAIMGGVPGGAPPMEGPPGPAGGALPPEEMPAEGPPPEEEQERPDPLQVLGDLESIVEQMKMALS